MQTQVKEILRMKNTRTFWLASSIAIISFIGFAMVACDTTTSSNGNGTQNGNGNGNGSQNGNVHLGDTFMLTDWVYSREWDEDNDDEVTLVRFDGDRAVTAYVEGRLGDDWIDVPVGTGTIDGGRLNISIGRPATASLVPMEDLFDWFDDITVSNPAARGQILWNLTTSNGRVEREYRSWHDDGMSSVENGVFYVFVDSDVRVSGEEYTSMWSDMGEAGSFTQEAFTLDLRKGWNVVHMMMEYIFTQTVTGFFRADTETLALANPASVIWVLRE